jgi:hypothetical protein
MPTTGLVTDRGMTLEVLWAFDFVDEGDGEVIGGDVACSVRGYQEVVCLGVETADSFVGLNEVRSWAAQSRFESRPRFNASRWARTTFSYSTGTPSARLINHSPR